MASFKFFALFLAFAMAAATLQPSGATRVQGFKPAAANQEAEGRAEPLSNGAPAGGDAQHPSTPPGLPGAPPMPGLLGIILPFLFPPIAGLPGFLPQILSPPSLFPPIPGLPSLFPPLPGSPPRQGGVQGGSSSPPPPQLTECMTPLVGMMPCMDYLTNITVLTPPGECCDGFKSIVSDAPICLCHGMNGDMNQFMPKPIDPVRMAILPLACGTMLPLQTLFMCNSQSVPPLMPPTPAEPPATPDAPPAVSP
ncbi:uncharacterized protein LOC133930236 [Phragmites australis]|uniref:uncharacterized protein LOC133930236 n=1 Tax=Phragmites australis TaxID=29695 RepID=UPI002D77F926|nr:uncharacterized protein LOC133930236 [Phragmites australis]